MPLPLGVKSYYVAGDHCWLIVICREGKAKEALEANHIPPKDFHTIREAAFVEKWLYADLGFKPVVYVS